MPSAHGAVAARSRPMPTPPAFCSLLRQRALLIFAASMLLLQLANAAMLPLMAGVVTTRSSQWAPRVHAAGREKRRMRAALTHAAVIDHEDLIRLLHRCEAVRDHDRRLPAHQLGEAHRGPAPPTPHPILSSVRRESESGRRE